MRELALLTFLTLDGVMQSPSSPEEDASGGFTHGGWARPCWDEVMAQVMEEAMAQPYDLLLGRATYETFAASFASADALDPTARKLNDAEGFVVTSTLEEPSWNNSKRITGDIRTAVTKLIRPNFDVYYGALLATLLIGFALFADVVTENS